MMVNVGLLTSFWLTPSPSANPRTNAVFPAPRSPNSRTTDPAPSRDARSRPARSVSASECVVMVTLRPSFRSVVLNNLSPCGQLQDRIANVSGEVGRRHGHFSFVRFGQVARHPVQIHGQLAGGFRIQ